MLVLNLLVLHYLRYYNGLYSDESLELFAMNQGAPLLIKNVGTSQHTDGVR